MANIHFFKLMNWDAVSPGFIAAHKNSFHHILSTRMSRASVGKRLKTPVFMQRLSLNGNNLGFVLTHWMIDEDCTLVLIGILTPFSFLFPSLSLTSWKSQCNVGNHPHLRGQQGRRRDAQSLRTWQERQQNASRDILKAQQCLFFSTSLPLFLSSSWERVHGLIIYVHLRFSWKGKGGAKWFTRGGPESGFLSVD